MGRPDVAIIIPALNEEATVGAVVSAVRKYGQVIVVNDGSHDATSSRACEAGATVVDHLGNRGYDAALNTGFRKARELGCRYIVTMDADGQHHPEIVQRYVEAMEKSADVVLGIRNRKQRISEHIFAALTSALYGVKDPLCGMKGYRAEVYDRLGHFDSYGSIGTELALYVVKIGHKFVQMPVPTWERRGTTRFGSILKGNYRIFRAMALSFLKIKPKCHLRS